MTSRYAFIVLLPLSTAMLGQTPTRKPDTDAPAGDPPKTVEQAVLVLKTKWLKPADLDWILRNPKDDVVSTLYRPFGTGVRNQFGLWGDNQALRDSCGTNNPEACSVVILNRLWDSVRADADPEVRAHLDCEFELAEKIQIEYRHLDKLTTGRFVKEVQRQIDQQMAGLAQQPSPPCQKTLTLRTTGKPDKSCYVYAKFDPKVMKDPEKIPLDHLLKAAGFQTFFRVVHDPPDITLEFIRSCQFAEAWW